MPRKMSIDRTLTITEANVIVLEPEKQKSYTMTIFLPKTYTNDASLLSALKKSWNRPDTVPVHIMKQKTYKRSFHMTEAEYINFIINKEKKEQM